MLKKNRHLNLLGANVIMLIAFGTYQMAVAAPCNQDCIEILMGCLTGITGDCMSGYAFHYDDVKKPSCKICPDGECYLGDPKKKCTPTSDWISFTYFQTGSSGCDDPYFFEWVRCTSVGSKTSSTGNEYRYTCQVMGSQ